VTVTDIHDEHTFGHALEQRLSTARRSIWMWSPWIANRARVVVPMIAAAVRRNVSVTVFLRPDDDRNMGKEWAQRRLPDLFASGATVIRSDQEHRKIVVIDDELVLIGSLNSLSNTPGTTREIMITMEGRAFADRLLTELRVAEIGAPRACAVCGRTMDVRRGKGRTAHLFWHCRSCNRKIS
jgi:phosphatidylserine/phosphatidylglycerophosphate/cardiolipin synthase-like enzyme